MTSSIAHLLPPKNAFRVVQSPGTPADSWLNKTAALIIVLPENPPAGVWRDLPTGTELRKLAKKHDFRRVLSSRLMNSAGTAIHLKQLPDSGDGADLPTAFNLLTQTGGIANAALADKPASLAVLVAGFEPEAEEGVVKAMLLALAAHDFSLPTFKSKAGKLARLKTVRVAGTSQRLDLDRTLIEADGLNLARWLTALPANKLDVAGYRGVIEHIAREHGWESEFLGTKKLAQAGAGAFLAVAQGSAESNAGIVRLRYRPKSAKTTPVVALVGKGVVFDTGGTNLKPFTAMLDMHHDMAGSAVALATLVTLTRLKVPVAVDCWLAVTENRISNTAYKSRDVVTACNGTTIEVIHTDAEGRMALADTLALAGRTKPSVILDFATLTGSCVTALTDRYSGALSNRAVLHMLLVVAGQDCGERVWPFPLDDDFGQEISSKVADVLQCAPSGGGDHIQAGHFLKRFVPESSAWVHIDLSSANRKGGLAQVPTNVTGFGVRYATELIANNLDTLVGAAKVH